jgi:ABC-2 type transport system permease protein
MTVVAAPPVPRTLLERLRWAVVDAWTVTRRDLAHWARQPAVVVVGLLFPVMTVLMFGYLFGGAMSVPGGGDYREFLLPGMFALTMVFGIEATMVAVTSDAAKGVTDRFRSMPMAPSAVVAGRGIADMLSSTVGLAALIACGLAVGWRWHHGAGQALLGVGLLLLLRFALLWVGIYLGLLARSPEVVTAVQILVWPLGFLSNAFVAPATMRCRAGSARSPRGTRCRRRRRRPGSCSATRGGVARHGSPRTPWRWRWCGRWSCSRSSSRCRCGASSG